MRDFVSAGASAQPANIERIAFLVALDAHVRVSTVFAFVAHKLVSAADNSSLHVKS